MPKGEGSPWKQGGKRKRREARLSALYVRWRRSDDRYQAKPRSILHDGSTVAEEPLFRVYLTRREVEALRELLEENVDLLSRYDRRQSPLSLKAEGRLKRKKALLASLPSATD